MTLLTQICFDGTASFKYFGFTLNISGSRCLPGPERALAVLTHRMSSLCSWSPLFTGSEARFREGTQMGSLLISTLQKVPPLRVPISDAVSRPHSQRAGASRPRVAQCISWPLLSREAWAPGRPGLGGARSDAPACCWVLVSHACSSPRLAPYPCGLVSTTASGAHHSPSASCLGNGPRAINWSRARHLCDFRGPTGRSNGKSVNLVPRKLQHTVLCMPVFPTGDL